MSGRSRLVSRGRLNDAVSPAQRRQRDEEPATREPLPLPPYEAPSCPLSVSGKRALESMKANDHPKYKKHLAESKKVIINAVSEMNDHVYRRKEKVRRAEARRHQQGIEDEDKTEEQLEEERYANQFEKKAGDATTQAEKAIRELIDYSDELAMQDTIMQEVNSNIASAPVPPPPARRRQRRQRNEGSDVDENEDIEEGAEEAPAADVEILSPLELFKQGKEDYTKKYTSKTMLERYENNDYKGFKRAVHDALNPGEGAPPLPPASRWFPEDRANASRNRRLGNSTDNTNNGESDSEEEVVIAGETRSHKCPLTLQVFVEPYSNKVCRHTFEKAAILEYHQSNAVAFNEGGRRATPAERQVHCPQTGCNAMLRLADFYDDEDLARQIKRAKRQALRDLEDDDGEEMQAPRGTQRNAEEIDSDQETRVSIGRVKRERQSRGPPSSQTAEDEMNMEVE